MTTHRQVFESFKEEVKKELKGYIEEIILFGSVARGEEKDSSDIDVLIVAKDGSNKEEVKESAIEIAYDKTLETGIYLSVKVLKESEVDRLETAGSPFLKEIRAQGEIVHA